MKTRSKKKPRRRRAFSASPASTGHEELLLGIPGYDPQEGAGDCRFVYEEASRAIRFFEEYLVHVKGEWAGKQLLLQPWQKSIVANLFGWKRPDGTRRYREALIMVPRKNSKTTMAAGFGLFTLFCDGEAGAEIYCAAAERDQAALLFGIAKEMVRHMRAKFDEIKRATIVYERSILLEKFVSSFKAISADAISKHGYNSHCVIIDELHAQKNRELVDVLMTSTGSRRQPLVIHITTADYHRESICNEKYDYACKVRDGIIPDLYFLPVIYEATLDDDWTSPEVWRKANPNLGVSIGLEYLREACERAKNEPSFENTFKRLHLNIRTEQEFRWIQLEKWDACDEAIDLEALKGRECFAGLDLASTTDIAALILLFPLEGGRYAALPFFWVPKDTCRERERNDRVPYDTWSRQGLIEATPGRVIDYDHIRRRVNELHQVYKIREIAIDRWNATQLAKQLADDGFTMEMFGQGYFSMSAPSKELERIVADRKLIHGGHKVLRWMASNVTTEMDAAGNIKPSRLKSSEKIDGIVGLVMALGRATAIGPPKRSVYEDRGLLKLW